MAGELKYGNTLVSSRKDRTLTYAKFVKGLDGKSVEDNLLALKDQLDNTDNPNTPITNTEIDNLF